MAMRVIKSKSMGRLQMLEWLNAFLESDYSRVEHLKDGIAFAQVLDAVNPGKVRTQQPARARMRHVHCARTLCGRALVLSARWCGGCEVLRSPCVWCPVHVPARRRRVGAPCCRHTYLLPTHLPLVVLFAMRPRTCVHMFVIRVLGMPVRT